MLSLSIKILIVNNFGWDIKKKRFPMPCFKNIELMELKVL